MSIGTIIAICAVAISFASYLLNKSKMEKWELNCLATLKTKVAELEKDRDMHRADLNKIFDRLDIMNREIGEVKTAIGKLNGK
jgi:hypothetical protein